MSNGNMGVLTTRTTPRLATIPVPCAPRSLRLRYSGPSIKLWCVRWKGGMLNDSKKNSKWPSALVRLKGVIKYWWIVQVKSRGETCLQKILRCKYLSKYKLFLFHIFQTRPNSHWLATLYLCQMWEILHGKEIFERSFQSL